MNLTELFVVEDAFEIPGRGCVVVPGLTVASPPVKVGSSIRLQLPDGTMKDTFVAGIEMLNYGPRPRPAVFTFPVLLPREFRKGNVPPGTKVLLMP